MEATKTLSRNKGVVRETRKWLCMPYGVFLILFIILPILLIFYYAFTDARTGAFTLGNFAALFEGDSSVTTFKVIGQSLGVAALTTVICILIAYPIAYILANSKWNKNIVLVYLFLLPMWINFVIRTIATKQLLIFFGLDPALHPWVCSIIGMVYNYLPFAILPLYNTMLKLDKSQIEAAADLGASPVQVFFKTIVPMTVPGIVSAATMTFMPTMSSYVITDALSGRTITLIGGQIENMFLNGAQQDLASVYAVIMLALIGLSVVFENLFSEKKGAR
ncbi:MAG: ABC transporter permease [Bacilli bacterium]|nr:ABC transporter permease [Bacilli bacterium]